MLSSHRFVDVEKLERCQVQDLGRSPEQSEGRRREHRPRSAKPYSEPSWVWPIDKRYPLVDVQTARHMDEGGGVGKVLLLPRP